MAQETFYKICPLCGRGPVTRPAEQAVYRCEQCGLTLKERALLGLFKKGRLAVESLGDGEYGLAWSGLKQAALSPDYLKVVLGNVYPDPQLAAIAGGQLDLMRPVQTVLAQIILEQLKETCFFQVNSLERWHGPPISGSSYLPVQAVSRQGQHWQDQGNLFGTDQRLVFPSNSFTFIRIDRKIAGIQAFTNGVALQRKGEEFATYFTGCYPHEAALVVAYVLGKLPALRQPAPESAEAGGSR